MYSKSETTINNILAAAQQLFLAKNYRDVTMTDIAEAAHVTKGALYYHFSSKQELYFRMMFDYLREQKARMRAVVTSEGTCRMRLRRLTVDFLNLPSEKYGLMKLVRRDINNFNNPAREHLIRAYQNSLPEQVEAIICDGIRDRELVGLDPRLLAWEYVAIVEVMMGNYARKVLGDSEKIADFVADMFFKGVARKQR